VAVVIRLFLFILTGTATTRLMALLPILEFPDPRLRKVAGPVTVFDEKLELLIDDMFETMYDAQGIGLAATQVDVHKRLLVIDVSENKDSPLAFINPEFEIIEDELSEYDEGCLSVPGFYETVSRPQRIRVRAQDRAGQAFEMEAGGILAVCIQHEIDHLEGKLFVDYLSSLKRQRIRKKLEKEHKKSA
jgi:peptide deformylase